MANDNDIKLPDLPEDIFAKEKSGSKDSPSSTSDKDGETDATYSKPSQYKATIPQPSGDNRMAVDINKPNPNTAEKLPSLAQDRNDTNMLDKAQAAQDVNKEDDMFEGMIENTTSKENVSSPPPLPQRSKKNIGRLITGIVIFILFAGGVIFITYNFFLRQSSVTDTPEDTSTVTETITDEVIKEEVIALPIDTNTWKRYTNEALGLTFTYPERLTILTDTLVEKTLKEPAIAIERLLHMGQENGSEMLTVWTHAGGLESFILPFEGIHNPFTAGTQFILTHEAGKLTVTGKSFQGFSGSVGTRLDTFVAYTPEIVGTKKFIFLLTSDSENGSELLTKIVESVELRSDSDGDGLFDDEEKVLGTDPENPDTDGDTYLDGQEVENGFNPLGEGRL